MWTIKLLIVGNGAFAPTRKKWGDKKIAKRVHSSAVYRMTTYWYIYYTLKIIHIYNKIYQTSHSHL